MLEQVSARGGLAREKTERKGDSPGNLIRAQPRHPDVDANVLNAHDFSDSALVFVFAVVPLSTGSRCGPIRASMFAPAFSSTSRETVSPGAIPATLHMPTTLNCSVTSPPHERCATCITV